MKKTRHVLARFGLSGLAGCAALAAGACTESWQSEKEKKPSWQTPQGTEPPGGWTGPMPGALHGWVSPASKDLRPVPCLPDVILGGEFAMGGWGGTTGLGIEVTCKHGNDPWAPSPHVTWWVPGVYDNGVQGYTIGIPIDPATGTFKPPANDPFAKVTYQIHMNRGDQVRFTVMPTGGVFGIVTGFTAPTCR